MAVAGRQRLSVLCLIFVVVVLRQGSCSDTSECDASWRQDSGRCYFFSYQMTNWTDARQACNDQGATLTTIKSQDQQAFIKSNLFLTGNWYWIGLSYRETEGTWVWEDHETLAQGYWLSQPTNVTARECGMLYSGSALWNVLRCDQNLHYICQKNINVPHTEAQTTTAPTTDAPKTTATTTETDTTTEPPTTTPTTTQTTPPFVTFTPTAPASTSPSLRCINATEPEIPDNMTLDQFKAQLVKQIIDELTLNASMLASSRAKKTSAPDSRLSSQMAGAMAIGVIVSIYLVTVLPDVATLVMHCKKRTSRKKSPKLAWPSEKERA